VDPLEELVQLLTESQEETRPRIAPPDFVRTWQRIGDLSKWQEVMFGSNSAESQAMIFDELDRAVGAPVGTMREAWALARAKGARRSNR
jgi:hypothetical protein